MYLEDKIMQLAERTRYTIDRLDLGITLTVAMSDEETADLEAMLIFLQQSGMEPWEILANVLHDTNVCKARYLEQPEGVCFLLRSHGYAQKIS